MAWHHDRLLRLRNESQQVLGEPPCETPRVGERVRLLCPPPDGTLRKGDAGTLQYLDSNGDAHVRWDGDAGMGIVPLSSIGREPSAHEESR